MRACLILLLLMLLTACNVQTHAILPSPPDNPADGWQALATGLDFRTYTPNDDTLAQLAAVRIDPAQYTFRAHYQSGQPLTLSQWREALPDAEIIVNANFFTPDYTVLGLLVSDGQVYGQPYRNRGGAFIVQPDGAVRVRSNQIEPYRGEPLQQAVQAFPMLVMNGQQAYHNANDTRRSRRTIIAQDTQGRIILMATPGFGLGLYQLSAFLPTTNSQFSNAFNLDGGGSTMMFIGANDYRLSSFDPVPTVLAVYAR